MLKTIASGLLAGYATAAEYVEEIEIDAVKECMDERYCCHFYSETGYRGRETIWEVENKKALFYARDLQMGSRSYKCGDKLAVRMIYGNVWRPVY